MQQKSNYYAHENRTLSLTMVSSIDIKKPIDEISISNIE